MVVPVFALRAALINRAQLASAFEVVRSLGGAFHQLTNGLDDVTQVTLAVSVRDVSSYCAAVLVLLGQGCLGVALGSKGSNAPATIARPDQFMSKDHSIWVSLEAVDIISFHFLSPRLVKLNLQK